MLNNAPPSVSRPPCEGVFTAATGAVVALSNFRDEEAKVDLQAELPAGTQFLEVFGNRRYGQDIGDLSKLGLDGWGYRWLRLRSS
jgi:hypothetical protein